MFYKKKGKPEINDTVICTVKKILYHSVFVSLDEYESVDGMIHISEIAPGRIRNLRDYVVEGKKIVCKVLNINKEGNIDLSLRRITTGVAITKLNDYKQEEKAEKLLEQVAKEAKLDLAKVYDLMGHKVIEKYGGLYPFFQTVFDKGKEVIEEFKPGAKFSELLLKTIKEKIRPVDVNVNGILTLRSFNSNGVEDVKLILNKIIEKNVRVQYLGAPKYKLDVISSDYKKAENILKEAVDVAALNAKKLGCEINFTKND